jgi:hypothetical protein
MVRRTILMAVASVFVTSIVGLLACSAFDDKWWEDGAIVINPAITNALFLVMTVSACCLPLAIAFSKRNRKWLLAIILVPFFVIIFALAALVTPIMQGPGRPLSSVPWGEGKLLHLVVESPPTDIVYGLYEASASWSLTWRKIDAPLTYSEDGSFTGNERLVIRKEQALLLVSRGGIWTDCLKFTDKGLFTCLTLPEATPPVEEEADVSRARSEAIAEYVDLETTEK